MAYGNVINGGVGPDKAFWTSVVLTVWTSRLASADLCGELERIYQEKENRFYLSKTKMPFFEGANFCLRLGLQLATIHDAYDLEKVEELLKSKRIYDDSVWIGANSLGDELSKTYKWYATGQLITYANWDAGQPDETKPDIKNPFYIEDCVYIGNYADRKYKWASGLCTQPLFVLCDDSCSRAHHCVNSYLCGDNKPANDPVKAVEFAEECQHDKWTLGTTLDGASCKCMEVVNKTTQPGAFTDISRLRFPAVKLSWFEARNWCLEHKLALSEIYAEADVTRIKAAVAKSRDEIWVGGTDWGQTGFWYWGTTGQTLRRPSQTLGTIKKFWVKTDGTITKQHCLYLNTEAYDWRDGDCFSKKYFVCENVCGDVHRCFCEDRSDILPSRR